MREVKGSLKPKCKLIGCGTWNLDSRKIFSLFIKFTAAAMIQDAARTLKINNLFLISLFNEEKHPVFKSSVNLIPAFFWKNINYFKQFFDITTVTTIKFQRFSNFTIFGNFFGNVANMADGIANKIAYTSPSIHHDDFVYPPLRMESSTLLK